MSASLMVGALLIACSLAVSGSRTLGQEGVPEDVVITLERTICFGECPVYTVSIDANGNVAYEGKQFVRVEGRQTDRIPISQVAALLETADRIGFFKLRDHYRANVTDLPTKFVTITRNGRTKRIEDYLGAPSGLQELEKQIDEVARTKRWVRIDEQTLRELVIDGWSPSLEERSELLRKALRHDDVEVIKELLAIGADANVLYPGTNTPPLMMVWSAAAARVLLDAGANPIAKSDGGGTPLGWAVCLEPEVTEVLIKAGVPADQPADSDGRTALWLASCRGNAGVVQLLLNAGANPDARHGGMSAIECARKGREATQARPSSILDGTPLFVPDFDRVIELLGQALATRRPK